MPRPALAASRAIDVLNFMAGAPLRGYSLTELVRALGLNPASCHALLNAMARDGYLVRETPGKTYRLGPALIAIGQGALLGHPRIAAARERMAAVADEFGRDCMLTVLVGEQLICLAVQGPGGGSGLQVGQRVPLIPPIGTPFLAWADPKAVDAWLGQAKSDAERERLQASLAAARERGYTVTLRSARQDEAGRAVAGLAEAPFEDARKELAARLISQMGGDYLLIENRSDKLYQVGLISAPVFAADGTVACSLALYGFDRPLSPTRLAALGKGLERHARAVTDSFAQTGATRTDSSEGDTECAR